MNKKVFGLLLAGLMLFSGTAFAEGETEKLISPSPQIKIQFTVGENRVVIDDDIGIDLDVAPCIIDDRTMIPFRSVFEIFGATVSWDAETKTVYGLKEDVAVVLQIGQRFMFVNSERVALDAPSVIVNDRTMVPFRSIAAAYGCTVEFDDLTKTVTIIK